MLVNLFVLAIAAGVLAWAPDPNSDAFTLPENQWTKIAEVAPDPLGRELEPGRGAFWCFVPDSGKFYRYGGYSPTENNDLWNFDLAARKWESLMLPDYSFPPPQSRPGAGPWWSMCYDTSRKVVWFLGGTGVAAQTHTELFDDIWKYDPASGQFTKMNSQDYYHGSARIVYDSKNDLVLRAPAYDGEWSYIDNRDKTWVYSPAANTWEGRATSGSPKHRLGCGWVFMPSVGKALYLAVDGATHLTVTWTYDAASNTWAQVNPTIEPPARAVPGIAWDPINELVVLHGGAGGPYGSTTYGYLHRGGGTVLEDTWVFDPATGQWTDISATVGKPAIPSLKKSGGSPLLPQIADRGRFVLRQAMDYDKVNNAVVISAPTYGVWALRYKPSGGQTLPALNLAALPTFPAPTVPERVFPLYPRNSKLVNLPENVWVKLGGGRNIGGDEIPLKYDETTGFVFKYGGCGDWGTTFASGYGNDLVAYDPAVEFWRSIRPTCPCGPPRPANGCTRFYAHDPTHDCIWFAGGTSGNHLAASVPQNWTPGNGTWQWDSRKDRYNLIPHSGNFNSAVGVVCAYDRRNDLFITATKRSWGGAQSCTFNSNTSTWTSISSVYNAQAYTYGDFIDSMGVLAVLDGGTVRTLDPLTGAWGTLPAQSGLPGSRPSVAYDPYNNVLMAVGSNKTFIFSVASQTWQQMSPDSGTPDLGEHVAFDRRHNVFLGGKKMSGEMWAYRYKTVPLPVEGEDLKREAGLISVYPNPFKPAVVISIHGMVAPLHATALHMTVYDIHGRMVHRFPVNGKNRYVWTATGRPSGLYIIRCMIGNKIIEKKIYLVK